MSWGISPGLRNKSGATPGIAPQIAREIKEDLPRQPKTTPESTSLRSRESSTTPHDLSARKATRTSQDPLGSSIDPDEILRRLKALRESGRGLESGEVGHRSGESSSPWPVAPSSATPGERNRSSLATPPMLGMGRNSLFSTPPTRASLQPRRTQFAGKGEKPLPGVYWLKAVDQLRPRSPRTAVLLSPRTSQSTRAGVVAAAEHSPRTDLSIARTQSPRLAHAHPADGDRGAPAARPAGVPQLPLPPASKLLQSHFASPRIAASPRQASLALPPAESPALTRVRSCDSPCDARRQSTCGMGTPSMILGSKCGLPLKTFHSSFRHLDVSEEQQAAVDQAVNAAVEAVKLHAKIELQNLSSDMDEMLKVAEEELEREHLRCVDAQGEVQQYQSRLCEVRETFFLRTDHMACLHLRRTLLLDFLACWKQGHGDAYAVALQWARLKQRVYERNRRKATLQLCHLLHRQAQCITQGPGRREAVDNADKKEAGLPPCGEMGPSSASIPLKPRGDHKALRTKNM